MKILNNMVMYFNSMNAQRFNADYDGDTFGVVAVHSEQAKKDALEYMTPMKNIVHERNNELLDVYEHEAIHAAFMLTFYGSKEYKGNKRLEINDLNELEPNINSIIEDFNIPVYIKNLEITLPYNFAVLNYALYPDEILIDSGTLLTKKNLYKVTGKILNYKVEKDFSYCMHNFDKFLLECSTRVYYCNTSFKLDHFALKNKESEDYKKTLINEPYTAFHQNQILFDRYISAYLNKDEKNILNLVAKSGARIKNVQLLKAASNNGIPTNIDGKAFKINIKESLLDGLTETQFFMTGDSARLALAQRQESIPKGGELQRKLYFSTGFLQSSDVNDCGCNKYLPLYIKNQHHLESFYGRYYKANDDTNDHSLLLINTKDKSLIGKTLQFRSPIYCKESNYKICNTCIGIKKPVSENLGAAIGAYISESIIQSVLRTHHFSGAFITEILPEFIQIIDSLEFKTPNIVKGSEENILKYKNFLYSHYYKEKDFELKKIGKDEYSIEIYVMPDNDDSVKLLKDIVHYIDKNRIGESEIILPPDLYNILRESIIMPNNIFSIFVELLLSIIFFDEDDVMIRYSDKPINKQYAIKNIINLLDPSLNIFYGFNDSKISDCYKHENKENLPHMYFDLLNIYY